MNKKKLYDFLLNGGILKAETLYEADLAIQSVESISSAYMLFPAKYTMLDYIQYRHSVGIKVEFWTTLNVCRISFVPLAIYAARNINIKNISTFYEWGDCDDFTY